MKIIFARQRVGRQILDYFNPQSCVNFVTLCKRSIENRYEDAETGHRVKPTFSREYMYGQIQ